MGLVVSTISRSEDQATSLIPLFLIPQLLFGGSIIPLVGKGLGFRILAAAMLSRWTFAGLGAANDLGGSPAIRLRYGSLFSHSVSGLMVIVVLFAVGSVAMVGLRLAGQRES